MDPEKPVSATENTDKTFFATKPTKIFKTKTLATENTESTDEYRAANTVSERRFSLSYLSWISWVSWQKRFCPCFPCFPWLGFLS